MNTTRNRDEKHLVLVGGGHAHVAVLADWAKHGMPADRATLLTPEPYLRYSGMVPGWISGEHAKDEARVDLAGLARAGGAELVLDRCVAIDPDARSILTQANGVLTFDIASIDTGGVGHAAKVLGDDPRLIDVRPIDGFVDRIAELPSAERIAVIGGGAGGIEIAFALRNRASEQQVPAVTLVSGEAGLLPDFSPAVRGKVRSELERQSIDLIEANARFENGELLAGDQCLELIDVVIGAVGSGAPDWPRASGLQCDPDGFIAVDSHMRSLSHGHIFAVGDVAARQDRHIAHSGVHAVMAGPALAANLRREIQDLPAQESYHPRPASLYLLSTGRGEAIASYGPFAAQGRWVAKLKAWIDKRWIARYAAISSSS
ncbi:FAD-dependent oxidoreductase [Erythrobacter sp. YT30]|uniref:FAD-dependent oxidoreductase n=1 Tax=Erythrobacter sp. YT30 TaxID=1735012 RepID=UPI00076CB84B|nr:FAD-dependent oxidoreductase [Erythrobacter sp. YT30]KWV90923.1 NADH dehydrogenase [Erythrobacter sp. YT30]